MVNSRSPEQSSWREGQLVPHGFVGCSWPTEELADPHPGRSGLRQHREDRVDGLHPAGLDELDLPAGVVDTLDELARVGDDVSASASGKIGTRPSAAAATREIHHHAPDVTGRLNHTEVVVAGRSYGATTASALVGARVIDADGVAGESFRDARVRAAVLLCLAGTGGQDLSPFARQNFPFMNPEFSQLTTPTLLVAGGADDSPLNARGPEWFTDAFALAPGVTDLLTLVGGEHSLGGINVYDDPHATDQSPDRVALIQQSTTARLRAAPDLDPQSWPLRPKTGA